MIRLPVGHNVQARMHIFQIEIPIDSSTASNTQTPHTGQCVTENKLIFRAKAMAQMHRPTTSCCWSINYVQIHDNVFDTSDKASLPSYARQMAQSRTIAPGRQSIRSRYICTRGIPETAPPLDHHHKSLIVQQLRST